MYGLYKDQHKENKELVLYSREMERENLTLLKDLKGVLEHLIAITNGATVSITNDIKKETADIKAHIDERIKQLEDSSE